MAVFSTEIETSQRVDDDLRNHHVEGEGLGMLQGLRVRQKMLDSQRHPQNSRCSILLQCIVSL
jgi:hypothetical protein